MTVRNRVFVGKVMYAMIDNQPPMPAHDRRRATADLESFPRLDGLSQWMMRDELTEAMLLALLAHAAIRDPDAFPMGIGRVRSGSANLFFGACAREQRPVQERDDGPAERARDQRGKNAGILVVDAVKRDAVIGVKSRKPDPA